MKQYIILVSMIILGAVLVNLIIGSGGIGKTAMSILSLGQEHRFETFIKADGE